MRENRTSTCLQTLLHPLRQLFVLTFLFLDQPSHTTDRIHIVDSTNRLWEFLTAGDSSEICCTFLRNHHKVKPLIPHRNCDALRTYRRPNLELTGVDALEPEPNQKTIVQKDA